MTPRQITQYIFIPLIILICASYDIYIMKVGGSEATISRCLYDDAKCYPGFAVIAGIVIGHLWFSQSIQ